MKRKFAIICICVFAVGGIGTGIISNTDSEAGIRTSKIIETVDKKIEKETQKSTSETHTEKYNAENRKMQSTTNVKAIEKDIEESVSSSQKKATSKNFKVQQPVHTHSWKEIYNTRSVKKIKYIPYTKCYACNEDMTGNPNHIDKHLLNGESNVHYGTEYKEEVYYETERYVSGYRCSCGVVK